MKLFGLGMVPVGKRTVKPIPAKILGMVPKPTDNNITLKGDNADPINDTVPLIKSKIKRTSYQVKKLAEYLKGSSLAQTLRNNYDFIFKHIQYTKDDEGEEQVRSPRRLIHDAQRGGDCDCFTVLLGALLTEQNIPFKIRVSANQTPGVWGHVYVVVPKDGDVKKPLRNKSQYYVLDPVVHEFNYEAPFHNTKDFAMKLVSLDGLGDACSTKEGDINRVLDTKDNGTAIRQFKRFIDTQTVRDLGLVPTKNFLTGERIPFRESNTLEKGRQYTIATPNGEQTIPSIITKEQAAAVKSMVNTPATIVPAQASAPTLTSKQEAGGILAGLLMLGGLVWSAFD